MRNEKFAKFETKNEKFAKFEKNSMKNFYERIDQTLPTSAKMYGTNLQKDFCSVKYSSRKTKSMLPN